jgi:hypothetical protein
MSSPAKEEKECQICTEKYTRSPVKCEYCPMEACRSCCEKYILGKNTITCMDTACNRQWTRKHISTHFTQSFINTQLKIHRENILFEKERQTFPEAIEKMTHLGTIKEDFQFILSTLGNENLNSDKSLYYTILSISNILFEKIKKHNIDANYNYIDIFLTHIDYHVERIYNIIFTHYVSSSSSASAQHLTITRITDIFTIINDIIRGTGKSEMKKKVTQCPTQSCNGILDVEMRCILCKKTYCSSCLEDKPLEEEHKCNPDTVETVNLLKTDTKSCPKCKANIYKIDGCDQMWCIKCHTAFSWKTGAIETKIHNPHYYEWMRANNGGVIQRNENENENICRDEELNQTHANILFQCNEENKNIYKYRFENEIKNVIHLREDELPKYAVNNNNNNNNRMENHYKSTMKMNYLNKQISEKEYKQFLGNEENKKDRNIEIYQLIQMWIVVKTDILKRILHDVKNKKKNDSYIYDAYNVELDELKNFIKSHLNAIEKTYKTKILLYV